MPDAEDARRTGDRAAPRADGAGDDAETALDDLPDGSGCTEIWAHLSDRRRRD